MSSDAMEVDHIGTPATEVNSYEWKYITDSLLADIETHKQDLATKIRNNEYSITKVFYELYLSVSEYPERATAIILTQIAQYILAELRQKQSPQDFNDSSTDVLILSQSMIANPALTNFACSLNIDKSLKILYLDKAILRSHGIFPDYGRYQYLDARKRVFSVESFSSLHESSEGYARFIMRLHGFLTEQLSKMDSVPLLIESLTKLSTVYELDSNRSFLIALNILSYHVTKNQPLVLGILKQSTWWSTEENNTAIQSTIIDYLFNYTDETCHELKLITLLIKHGQLDFNAIYNSLGPIEFSMNDSDVLQPVDTDSIKQLYEESELKKLADAQISTVSALSMASMLPDSDDSDSEDATIGTEKETEKVEEESIFEKAKLFRKVQFLKHLIDLQMIDEAVFILNEYPQIPLIYDHISDTLNSVIDLYINGYYMTHVNSISLTKPKKDISTETTVDSFDAVIETLEKFATFNQHKIARCASLITKLIRITSHALANGLKDADFCLQFFRVWIFPYLAFTNNIPVVNEAFAFLHENYSLETKYNLYGEYQFKINNDATSKYNYDVAGKKTKDLLKRLSIENITLSSRTLNKLVSINPLATSNAFVSHIESYSSLIDLICESSKYFNDYAWDVITYQILAKLNNNRAIMQPDGLNYSQWFANLSLFIGQLGKLYPGSFQLSPILLNVVKALMVGETDMIGVFKDVLDSMSGIKAITNLTTKQIMRMNAEKCLKQLAYMSLQDTRESCRRSCGKLLSTLISDKIFSQMFILLCQIPVNLIDSADDKPLKFVNQRCDDVNLLIHELVTAIDHNLPHEVFKNNIDTVTVLMDTYSIQPQWAFEIWRRHLSTEITANDNSSSAVFGNVEDSMVKCLEYINWSVLDPGFYFTFWTLSLYDINFDDLSYMMEESELKSELTGINLKLRRKDDLLARDVKELNLKHSRIIDILKYMKHDMGVHEHHYTNILERLNKEKGSWFKNDGDEQYLENNAVAFLEHCALPRLQHSSFDSVFVAKFIFFVNKLETPVYSLKRILNTLFMSNFLNDTFFTNTTIETENLGLFYQIVLEKLNSWWNDETIYERESNMFNDDTKFNDFRTLLFKWHDNLLNQILASLDSEDYTTRNNCILFLKMILTNYPVIEEHADTLNEKLTSIIEEDTREDIKLSSRALIGLLKFRESKFISIWKFYDMETNEKEAAMKKHAEKMKAIKQREEELKKAQAEEERKEREKNQPVAKPYGLVGLSKVPSAPASADSGSSKKVVNTEISKEVEKESEEIVEKESEEVAEKESEVAEKESEVAEKESKKATKMETETDIVMKDIDVKSSEENKGEDDAETKTIAAVIFDVKDEIADKEENVVTKHIKEAELEGQKKDNAENEDAEVDVKDEVVATVKEETVDIEKKDVPISETRERKEEKREEIKERKEKKERREGEDRKERKEKKERKDDERSSRQDKHERRDRKDRDKKDYSNEKNRNHHGKNPEDNKSRKYVDSKDSRSENKNIKSQEEYFRNRSNDSRGDPNDNRSRHSNNRGEWDNDDSRYYDRSRNSRNTGNNSNNNNIDSSRGSNNPSRRNNNSGDSKQGNKNQRDEYRSDSYRGDYRDDYRREYQEDYRDEYNYNRDSGGSRKRKNSDYDDYNSNSNSDRKYKQHNDRGSQYYIDRDQDRDRGYYNSGSKNSTTKSTSAMSSAAAKPLPPPPTPPPGHPSGHQSHNNNNNNNNNYTGQHHKRRRQ